MNTSTTTSTRTNASARSNPPVMRRISSTKRGRLDVRSHRIWLDEASRERIERLHLRIANGLGFDASLSILVRVALAELEAKVRNIVPGTPHAGLEIPSEAAVGLKLSLLTAARGEL